MTTEPPFRAEQVGSLLRPLEVKDARAKRERGEIGQADLKSIEDKCDQPRRGHAGVAGS